MIEQLEKEIETLRRRVRILERVSEERAKRIAELEAEKCQ